MIFQWFLMLATHLIVVQTTLYAEEVQADAGEARKRKGEAGGAGEQAAHLGAGGARENGYPGEGQAGG